MKRRETRWCAPLFLMLLEGSLALKTRRHFRAGVAGWVPALLLLVFPFPGRSATHVLVADANGVHEFDGVGNHLGIFGDTGGANLVGIRLHPVTGNLFGAQSGGGVLEYDGTTGALIGAFGTTTANLLDPQKLAFHPTTLDLFVLDGGAANPAPIRQFDGATGAFVGGFGATAAHLTAPLDLDFHPATANLFVVDAGSDDVREFDGSTGAFVGVFGDTGTELSADPGRMAFSLGSHNLFIADRGDDALDEFDGTTGSLVRSFTGEGNLSSPSGIAFGSLEVTIGLPNGKHAVMCLTEDNKVCGVTGTTFLDGGTCQGICDEQTNFDAPPNTGETRGHSSQGGEALDPISTPRGELYEGPILDLFLGGSMPLRLSRYYASKIRSDGNIRSYLGRNWLHNFDWRLAVAGTVAKIVTSRGRVIFFVESSGVWGLVGKADIAFQLVESAGDFLLLDPRSDLIYTFDGSGRLIEIADGAGNAHTLTYDSLGLLTEVTDGLGRTLTFTYDAGLRLSQVTDGTRTVTYGHTVDDLTSFTDALGNTTTYAYDPRGLLTSWTLPRGNTPFTQTWDAVGRVTSQTDADGNTYALLYDGLETTVTDPLGNTRVHSHSAAGALTGLESEDGATSSQTFDGLLRKTSKTDRRGETSLYTYHAPSGKIASLTLANGAATSFGYTARAVGALTFWDLTSINYPDGTSETFVHDASGALTSRTGRGGEVWTFTRNARGQLATATNPLGGVTTYTYNADGTLAGRIDPTGRTAFAYDDLKRLERVNPAVLPPPPRGEQPVTRDFTWDDNDNLLTFTDELDNVTTFTWDANNRLETVTDALGNTTTYAYDAMNRVVSVTDPEGEVTAATYDVLGRLATITDANGDPTTFAYDARGRLVSLTDGDSKVWTRSYDLESVLTGVSDPLGNTSTFTIDALRRVTGASGAGATGSYTYDSMGRVTTVTDALGAASARTFDANGQVASESLPEGIGAVYGRNALGRLTSLTDANGNAWLRGYDVAGRPTSWTDPLGRVTTASYDLRNRVRQLDLPSSTVDFTYDETGNLTRQLYSDGTDLGYTYDDLGRLIAADGVTLAYDGNSRLVESNGITLTRDPVGRIATMTLAPGRTLTYTYDDRGLLVELEDWLPSTMTFTYDAAGRLTTVARPNGVHTTYTYDGAGRVVGIVEAGVSSVSLTRDAKGQMRTATRNVPQASAVSAAATNAQTYDIAAQVVAYTYDAMGRRTADGTRTYVWDLASRLTSYTEAATTVSFGYDALGNRTSRDDGGVARVSVWNHALGLPSVSVIREGPQDVRYYVHTPDGSLLYRIEAAGDRRDYHFDEMGNTLFLTDAAGAVLASYAYDPYGRLLGSTGAVDNVYTWQGRHGVEREGTTGLYSMRARFYDAELARFLSPDPLPPRGARSANPYPFALGNPKRFVDPTGLESEVLLGVEHAFLPEFVVGPRDGGDTYGGGDLFLNGDREQDYLGHSLTFTKRLADRWMLRGSLTDWEWNIPAGHLNNSDPNHAEEGIDSDSGVFDLQCSATPAKTDVWLQSSWQHSVSGMYQVAPDRPWGFNAAADLFGRQGYPLGYWPDYATKGRTRDLRSAPEIDGFRADDMFTIPRIDKEYTIITSDVSFTLSMDFFNLLNEQAVLERQRSLSRGTADFVLDNLSPRVWRIGSGGVVWR